MALLKSGTRIYGNAIIDTNLSINGSTVSSSYDTGALVVKGGLGVAGNVFINANLNVKDTYIVGNLTVTGTTTTVNSTTTQLEDPVIDLGGGANGATLTTDDGLARGLALHYYSSGAQTAFIGYDNANGQFAVASNVTNTDGTLTINTYGNLKANYFLGTFSGVGSLSQLSVSGVSQLGLAGNVRILGGSPDYILRTDGQGNLTWVAPATTTAGGANTQVQYNNDTGFGASANFTFDSTTKTLTVDKIVANGSGLTSLAGANVTGTVANATYALNAGNAYSVAGSNVSGQVGNALVAGTVYTASQPSITSVGTLTSLTVSGNITAGNVAGGNLVSANYIKGNGSLLSSITGSNVSGQVANALVAGTVYSSSQPNITSVGTLTDLTVSGNTVLNKVTANIVGSNLVPNANITYDLGNSTNRWKDLWLSGTSIHLGDANLTSSSTDLVVNNGNITANYLIGDGSKLTNISSSAVNTKTYIVSNVSNVVAGSTISIVADYANSQYPGGVFTIEQLGPVTLSTTDIWASGTATKNAYANYLASSINTQNVNITLTLSNATFSINSSDTITIGSSTITGSNLLALNITGNGTYTIPSSYFSSTVQTTSTSSVNVSLTTSRGKFNSSGTTLNATQPVAFTLNSLTGSFPSSTVPYFNLNQSFNWSATVTGSATAGNITYSGGLISSTYLTRTGQTSGTSDSIDSTSSYTLSSLDLYGSGLYGYGNRTIPSTVTGTVAAATKYYPVFYKITNSATIPQLTTNDSYLTHQYVLGDGATTSGTTSDYLWIAIPGVSSHSFAYTFLGSQVGQDPAITSSQTISGYSYNIYGFTNFSVATFLYTVT